MKINPTYGYWENDTTEGHGWDQGIANGILHYLKLQNAKDVYDFGCGTGYYTKYLNDSGIFCIGYDGNPNTREIASQYCYPLNLAESQLFMPVDWVISLEVAEHIPPEKEKVFIDNVHKANTKGVIISWSIPEYGGDGHVNSKNNSYVIDLFNYLGYYYDKPFTDILRTFASPYPTPCYWFSKTIMIFKKGC